MIPLYEAKMLHLYETRWATYEPDGTSRLLTEQEKAAHVNPLPRYWVAETEIDKKLGDHGTHNALIGWRRICRATDARTLILTQGPRVGYGDSWFFRARVGPNCRRCGRHSLWTTSRVKSWGTNMNFFTFMQLPTPRPGCSPASTCPRATALSWLGVRVDRLNGWIPDPTDRAQARAELDAAAFHLYGLDREEVSYVMDAFPIVKRKDRAAFGSFRTKELIMVAYDAMTEATVSGQVYREVQWC